MRFSIITICYNSENEIRRTIESVLAQSYSDFEYVIIDGFSSDSTVSIAEEYKDRFVQKGCSYQIFSEPDKGIYDAMNKGIKKASGEIIGIINSGDWYEPNALSVVDETFREHPFDLFYADINIVRANGKIVVKRSGSGLITTSRHWNHPTSFVTKSTYEELGAFKCEGIHDDFEFFLRVKKAKKDIVIKNIVLANFMLGGVSNKRDFKSSVRRVKDRYMAYRTNGYSPAYIIECIAMEIAKSTLR